MSGSNQIKFSSSVPQMNFPAEDAANVSPDDSNDLPGGVCRALYIGGAGNVNVTTRNGTTLVISGLTAGSTLPLQVIRVKSTSTTCSLIVALY